jgi:hypothetical protein
MIAPLLTECWADKHRKVSSMKKQFSIFLVLFFFMLLGSCKDSGTDTQAPPTIPPPNGLSATPPSVRILPGVNAVIAISGGTRPEIITSSPNASVATASLTDTSLTVHGVGIGSTSMQVADHSSPSKTVDIAITIATSAVAIIIMH